LSPSLEISKFVSTEFVAEVYDVGKPKLQEVIKEYRILVHWVRLRQELTQEKTPIESDLGRLLPELTTNTEKF